ncbi:MULTISPECIES: EAL domain-containing protein [unclassified Colwellia]|uniref:bifunctional diguanylate cyclase/phosphodiesterase n=1 Tax=unclassified Colwellia TaxID=196834 RepID=UPI0015F66B9A|nr:MULTISPECIES: EAL domain-containing protein [unclassified Colwellia]MBA6380030.1 EAL domain-containing protein [Colwellia sp. BRX10-7]MBA6387302.1 EAL domain-containing protein [Colwellia sp. BRX10-2]MBA6402261.1 EAL domain-containing protein [Colwellia sp. BRX10-5]MBA6406530.1 EAL domain-containing protein [Colwellia sp. BRX10-1]
MTDPLNNELDKLNESDSLLAKEAISLLDKYRKLEDRYTALFKLNQLSHDCADLSMFYGQVHQSIASVMRAENFYIALYDQTLSTLEFVYDVDEKDDYPLGKSPLEAFEGSMTCYVIETAKPLLATPEIVTELETNNSIKRIGSDSTDWLGVPLLNDGVVIGVMAVQSYSEALRYQVDDLELMEFTAQHIVTAMTRLHDHERLQNAVNSRTRELMKQIREREKSELLQESLFKISELTNDATLHIDEFYSMVHNIVGQLINAQNFYITKYDQHSKTLTFVYYLDQNSTNAAVDSQPRVLGNGFTEYIIRTGETQLLNYPKMYALYQQGETKEPQIETKSWLGVPLIHSGVVLGAMVLQSYNLATTFTEQDAELLKFVSQHVASAIQRRDILEVERQSHILLEQQVKLRTVALEDEIKQRKQAEEKLQHTASHDILTGLPNRTLFINLLNHAIACHKRKADLKFAVLFLDLDRFKVVNDSLGHHAGDLLLQEIAKELKVLVRDKDTVARLGGDEFVILIEDLESNHEAYDIAQRITDFLATPFTIENQSIFIGTSIGVLFNNERYDSADIMLRDADTAMYHAKDKGKGRYEVFDSSMQKKVQHALELEADIRDGIANSEFSPYFQPIVDLKTETVVGFEALARWQSNKRGFVYPDDFIPLAEETNLVMAIDFLILEKSCLQLKQWEAICGRNDLYVSCNLYGNHFFSATLPADIEEIIQRVGIKPSQLRVELTERALLENSDLVLENMNTLKVLGVKILLDDFGTGYSSLSYLHRFPIDVLKIDRSFINNAHEHDNHQAIIKTIIDLATNLNMGTVGEGIENLADAELLTAMACRYGQGYYYAKPMAAADSEKYLLK